jgi:hypothetical protein
MGPGKYESVGKSVSYCFDGTVVTKLRRQTVAGTVGRVARRGRGARAAAAGLRALCGAAGRGGAARVGGGGPAAAGGGRAAEAGCGEAAVDSGEAAVPCVAWGGDQAGSRRARDGGTDAGGGGGWGGGQVRIFHSGWRSCQVVQGSRDGATRLWPDDDARMAAPHAAMAGRAAWEQLRAMRAEVLRAKSKLGGARLLGWVLRGWRRRLVRAMPAPRRGRDGEGIGYAEHATATV